MKTSARNTIAAAAAALILASAGAAGAETAGSAYGSLGIVSQYVWRGQELSKEAAVQPSVGFTYGAYSANLWSNYDTDLEEMNETDLTLSYSRTMGNVGLSLGYIYYGLEGLADTQELYLTLSYATLLSPSVTIYYDFDEGDGAFITASVGHSFPLPGNTTLKLGASAGFCAGNEVMGLDEDGEAISAPYYGEVSAALAIPVGKLTIEPRLAWSTALSDEAEAIFETLGSGGESDVFYGGVTLTFGF
jgi:hypothetical protein